MPSHLRLESTFDPITVPTTFQKTSPVVSSPPTKKARTNKMTLTQTYYVASTARSKLGREAARADHNLRRLVGHANMLDRLMVELSQAEAEQEAWFNASVRTAAHADEPRRVQWVDTIAEETEEESDDEDAIYDESDNESDFDEDELESEMFNIPLRRLKSPPVQLGSISYDDEEEQEEEEEDQEMESDEEPATPYSPPELTYDDSDSEEDMPSSPRNLSLEISEKDRQAIANTTALFAESDIKVEDFATRQQPVIAAC